jgi:hypothetical protein
MLSENRFAPRIKSAAGVFGSMLLRSLFLGAEHRAKPAKVKRYRRKGFIAAPHKRVGPAARS